MSNAASTIDMSDEESSMQTKWEETFNDILANKNMSVKDVDTAQFIFFTGAAKLLELIEELRPDTNSVAGVMASAQALENLREEIMGFLGEEDDDTSLWTAVPHTLKDKDEEVKGS